MNVPFLDLARDRQSQRAELDAAIARVLESGRFVLGEEVARFEEAFAAVLRRAARGRRRVGHGRDHDRPARGRRRARRRGDHGPNTCVPTIVGIERAGAGPVLADVDPVTYTLDPAQVERALTPTHARDRARPPLRPDWRTWTPLLALARARARRDRGLRPGARRELRRPAGGLARRRGRVQLLPDEEPRRARRRRRGVTTDDADRRARPAAAQLRRAGALRARPRGLNSRLDELQAAVLLGAAAAARRVERPPPRARGRICGHCCATHDGRAGRTARAPSRLPPLRRPGRRDRDELRAAARRARDRHRRPLPDARPPAARLSRSSPSPAASRSRSHSARGCSACPSRRTTPTRRSRRLRPRASSSARPTG